MSDQELSALLGRLARNDKTTADTARALAVAIHTLQRSGDVAGMRVDELDLEAGVWRIGAGAVGVRGKRKSQHAVPLTPPVLSLIAQQLAPANRPRHERAPVFVFPGRADHTGARPLGSTALTRAIGRLRGEMGSDFRLHDLRRTGATWLGDQGFARFDIGRVLGHASERGGGPAATSVYDRSQGLMQKRAALEAWSAHVEALGRPGGLGQKTG